MTDIYLTNTLTKKKELFTPITMGSVGMYHCGPTVYYYVHIGNLRAFILADIVRRVFEYNGYKINQVMNITDVGHLVSDGDEGEDKMTKGLKREGLEVTLENMLKLASMYQDAFVQDIVDLNIKEPKIVRASEHILEDIEMIKKLEEKGYTYKISDGIYFDTSKMTDYGKLGGIDMSNDGESRIGEVSEKKSARDFCLWKFDATMGWDTPWGKGFPGWHIECSGMSMKYLGNHFDIHTGGHDLASIHHNNEIAQSECATGEPFVNYWLHNEFVNVEGAKMAKSGDNFITLRTLTEKGFDPIALRYLYLQSHYRSQVSFSWESLTASQTAYKKLKQAVQNLPEGGTIHQAYKDRFTDVVNDDLNIAHGLALTWELLKDTTVLDADKKVTILSFDNVLGLGLDIVETVEISGEVQMLLDERKNARDSKDFAKSDELRDAIKELGYIVKDGPEGQNVQKV